MSEDNLVKITKEPNGSFNWSCSIEVEYYRRNMGLGFKACLGIAAFLLLFGGFLAYRYGRWTDFLIVAGCTAVFLLITFLAFGLTLLAKDPQESYVMSDTYVKNGYGRSSVYFDFKKAQTVILSQKYIELHGKIAKIRVYAPEEDFEFVRSYIMNRLPRDCEIRRE